MEESGKANETSFICCVPRLVKGIVRKRLESGRANDRYVETVSWSLWPWQESKLVILVGIVALLDYVSTYAFLELSGNKYLCEGGLLASWALQIGGFKGLFLVDLVAASSLVMLAILVRFLHFRFGYSGFGRIAFVLLLVPYAVITLAVVFNNIVLTFI